MIHRRNPVLARQIFRLAFLYHSHFPFAIKIGDKKQEDLNPGRVSFLIRNYRETNLILLRTVPFFRKLN